MMLWLAIILTTFAVDDVQPVDFETQVMPILTKAGCNAGACHGAAAGRGGFHLSLYGSRPHDDYQEIVRALEGRRINHRQPDQSLLLQKPTEQLNHEGGTRLEFDGANVRLIELWISQGASSRHRRQLQDFEFKADRQNVASVGESVRLQAQAQFNTGTVEDVLRWTVLTAGDPSAIRIENDGTATLLRTGRHLIVARYLDRVVPLELIVPFTTAKTAATSKKTTTAVSDIDRFINNRLAQLGLQSGPPADDAALLRRLSLDLTGRLPDMAQVRTYAQDPAPDKRRRLTDRLIASKAFEEFWTYKLAQLLRVKATKGDPAAMKGFYNWLQQHVADDSSFSKVTRQLLLADGSVVDHPAANFYVVTGSARAQAEFISQAFLGVRMQCANCHDHPLDSWTQDDYHGLAAIFAGLKRGPVIRFTKWGEVIHPATGEPAVARLPGGPFLQRSDDNRHRLAEWVTSADNPYFARAMVNRTWSHLMGRGLVEPVDDLRATNPATHPELLNWLTQDFRNHDLRPKHLIRQICLSDAYAHSSEPVAGQPELPEYYAAAIRKPMSAEVFLDAVADVTGVAEEYSVPATGSRAVSLAGMTAESEALDLLGRCTTAIDCVDSSVAGDDLTVLLHLLNGELLNRRLADSDGLLAQTLIAGSGASQVVTDFYLRAYLRKPTDEQLQFWVSQFPPQEQTDKFNIVAQDFLWSLLNSEEFMTNH